jgi:hypothetical protein
LEYLVFQEVVYSIAGVILPGSFTFSGDGQDVLFNALLPDPQPVPAGQPYSAYLFFYF